MTDQDIRRVKADLLLEHSEVMEKLQHARVALIRKGEALERLGKRLKLQLLGYEPLSKYEDAALCQSEIVTLISEVNALAVRLDELAAQRRALGI